MPSIIRDIKEYDGLYGVDEFGNVYSRYFKKTKILKPYVSKRNHTNYQIVDLYKDKKYKHVYIHTLVATYFVAGQEEGKEVNHIDNNGENNKASNLEWVTRRDNIMHSVRQGRNSFSNGEYQRSKNVNL